MFTKNLLRIYLFLIISSQLLIVFLLIIKIAQKKEEKVLGSYVVNPTKKESLNFQETSEFKHFYETEPNATIVDSAPWLSYQPKYQINSDGFNSNRNYEVNKDSGVFRILAIGDSHTFGFLVDTEDNYPSQLEKLLNQNYSSCNPEYNKFEVINIGEKGYDIAYTIHRFISRGKKYNPDLILWYIKEDDFIENTDVLWDVYPKCLDESSIYQNKKATVEDWFYCYEKSVNYMHTKYSEKEIFDNNKKLLKEFISSLTSKIVFFGYEDESPEDVNFLNSISDFNKVYYFNKIKFKELPRLPDSHPSAKGYSILADKLGKYIGENFLNCN